LAALITALEPAAAATPAPFPTHLARVLAAFRSLAPELDWSVPGNRQLAETLEDIETEAHRFPPGSFAPAAAAIRQRLMAVIERPQASFSSHLAIYGLLEARLMQPDVTILGGLNEGTWPAQPDGGPWINRRMRAEFGLQQPERAIGQTAHDFAQAFCSGEVYLTWSQRIGTAPAIPSRWVLRLGTVLAALGRKSGEQVSGFWPALARALDRSNQFRPTTKPSPRPPVMARPRRISVTQVETLVRDPYALYATEVLQLAPLKPLAAEPDAALRGSLFHRALGAWNQTLGETPGSAYLDRLIAAGEAAFAPFMEDQDIAYFWWPRFLRMARWMAEAEPALRAGVLASHAEISGVLDIDIAGERHRLTGRADRIDILPEGARIIDYKTGKPPSSSQVASGFAPQLTLEAAMLARGAFAAAGRHGTAELLYITSSGGTPPGELKPIDFTRSGREPIQAVAERQFENFKTLLGHYMKAGTPYLPRLALEQEDDDSAFDHLSRYREWSLSGGGTG
jgi:ATP-dependent helicase/nuclease subunit B